MARYIRKDFRNEKLRNELAVKHGGNNEMMQLRIHQTQFKQQRWVKRTEVIQLTLEQQTVAMQWLEENGKYDGARGLLAVLYAIEDVRKVWIQAWATEMPKIWRGVAIFSRVRFVHMTTDYTEGAERERALAQLRVKQRIRAIRRYRRAVLDQYRQGLRCYLRNLAPLNRIRKSHRNSLSLTKD